MPNWWDEKLADGKTMGEKCERFIFDFDTDVEIEPPLTLTFEQAFAIPRERFSSLRRNSGAFRVKSTSCRSWFKRGLQRNTERKSARYRLFVRIIRPVGFVRRDSPDEAGSAYADAGD